MSDKMLRWIGAWLRLVVGCALALSWAATAAAQQDAALLSVLRNLPDRIPFPVDVVQSKSAVAARSAKIDPLLLTLSDDVSLKGPSSLTASAGAFQMSVRENRIAVKLIAEDRNGREELEWRVEDEGGVVTATLGNVVLANLPVDRIEVFEDEADLYYMTAQAQFSHGPPEVGAVSRPRFEAGVRAIGAERLHAAGVTGRGVKVGILDFGFQGYESLMRRGALPRPVAQRAFNQSGRLENGNVHGTACAEIVHAVAPDAELYLAAVGEGDGGAPEEQLVLAAQWLAAQDLDIISFSGGGHNGPHNGTALLDRLVEEIVAETGVLWVNAAGNEGAKHWAGSAADRDRDQMVELEGGFRGVAVRPSPRGVIDLRVIWDDWGPNPMLPAATQDIDAFLFEVVGGSPLRLVARSETPQRGRGAPMEFVQHLGRRGGQYVLAFRASRLTRPVRLHVYNLTGSPMEPASATGSIGIPATARAALAVGAVDVGSGRLESFSSQGPTDDGRTKPEVSAPDKTLSLAYNGAFPGTSAACPHVSGFAALLKQLNPSADREALSAMVMRHVRPLGGRTPNNEYGHGHIDARNVGGVDGPTIELPSYLGGLTPVRALDTLWERDRTERSPRLGLRVRVNERPERDGELPRYRIGDPMKVGFATDERCRYTLILRNARGEYRVMASSELIPGEPQLVPEEEGVSWTISDPVGEEGFLLVCSRSDVDVEDWAARGNAGGVVDVAVAEYRVVR